jgi:dienelactone hydrolase
MSSSILLSSLEKVSSRYLNEMIKTKRENDSDRIAKRSSYQFFFKNKDMDFYLVVAIMNISNSGASFGKLMYAAQRIKENDPDSWAREFIDLARKCEKRADEAMSEGNIVSAREAYLHAFTYYRIAIIGINPSDKLRNETYNKFVSCFQRGAENLEAHIEPITVPWIYNDREYSMPGYFMSPDDSGVKRPTIISINGGEMFPEDQYFWGGAEALRRGFNVLVIAYEGQRAPPILYPDLPALDPATAMKAPGFHKFMVDYALSRPETDPDRLAAVGFSSGAYQAMHQASFDSRIKALVLAAPLYDIYALLAEEIPKALQNAPAFILDTLTKLAARSNAFTRVSLEHTVDASRVKSMAELMALAKRIPPVDPASIHCPVLCLVGDGDSDEQLRQCRTFYEDVSSRVKEMKVFTKEDGASMHCQIDNFNLLEQVAFDWLETMFNDDD